VEATPADGKDAVETPCRARQSTQETRAMQLEEDSNMKSELIPLSLATIEDMVAELERRLLVCALFVSHIQGKDCIPCADVPSGDREKVYSDTWTAKHPALQAIALIQGIQLCLDSCIGRAPANASIVKTLSRKLQAISAEVENLFGGG
jgi:hypothetical protein